MLSIQFAQNKAHFLMFYRLKTGLTINVNIIDLPVFAFFNTALQLQRKSVVLLLQYPYL